MTDQESYTREDLERAYRAGELAGIKAARGSTDSGTGPVVDDKAVWVSRMEVVLGREFNDYDEAAYYVWALDESNKRVRLGIDLLLCFILALVAAGVVAVYVWIDDPMLAAGVCLGAGAIALVAVFMRKPMIARSGASEFKRLLELRGHKSQSIRAPTIPVSPQHRTDAQYQRWQRDATNAVACGLFGFLCPLFGIWGIVGLVYAIRVTHSQAPAHLKTRATGGLLLCILQVTLIGLALLGHFGRLL